MTALIYNILVRSDYLRPYTLYYIDVCVRNIHPAVTLYSAGEVFSYALIYNTTSALPLYMFFKQNINKRYSCVLKIDILFVFFPVPYKF